MADSDVSRNFLEVVVNPPDAGVDIVAVHGLNPFKTSSNAKSTWTSTEKNASHMWLQDQGFLPSKIPNARILVFGYNSNVALASGNAGVNQHARNLLFLLRLERDGIANRPVVFICHSLGGLLVKRALVIAFSNNVDLPLYQATYGIVFFGTPHGGGNNVNVGKLAASIARAVFNKPENDIMTALSKSDFYAEQNRVDFIQRAKDFYFISFFETLPTKGTMIVDRINAVLGLPDEKEVQVAVDGNHLSICKFSDPNSLRFKMVWMSIRDLCNKAITASQQQKAPEEPPLSLKRLFFNLPEEDVKFQGRDDIIQQIHDHFWTQSTQQSRVVIHGLSGIGKSALAARYLFSFRHDYEGIFWISFESKTSMERDLQAANLYVRRKDGTDLADWCSYPLRKHWLLVADNMDNLEDLLARENNSDTAPSNLIPHGGKGHIIITTQRRDLSHYGKLMELGPLSPDDSRELLLSQSEGRHEKFDDAEVANAIVEKLGYVPMAIKQCGTFVGAEEGLLKEYSIPFDDLIARINIPDETITAGPQSDDGLIQYQHNKKTILTTWEVSFQVLSRVNKDATDLLTMFGFLDGSDISFDVLSYGIQPQKRWDQNGGVSVMFLEGTPEFLKNLRSKREGRGLELALRDLVSRSLLFRKRRFGRYFIHPLTQYWLRVRTPSAIPSLVDQAIFLLANGFPDPEFATHYGHQSGLADRQRDYQAHIDRIVNDYESPDSSMNGFKAQTVLARLLLHDTYLTYETRKATWGKQPANSPGPRYKVIEKLIRRSDMPPFIWILSVYVYFQYHRQGAATGGLDFTHDLKNFEYAGKSWLEVHREALRGTHSTSAMAINNVQLVNSEAGTSQAPQDGLLLGQSDDNILKPIINNRTHTMSAALYSGYVGKFVLRYVKDLEEKANRPCRIEQGDHTLIIIDTRTGDKELWGWMNAFTDSIPEAELKNQMSDLELLTWNEMRYFQADRLRKRILNTPVNEAETVEPMQLEDLFPIFIEQTTRSALAMVRILGFECQKATNAALQLIWDAKLFKMYHRAEAIVREIISIPLSSTNFYAFIKTIDAYQHVLFDQEKWTETETMLLSWLEQFRNMPQRERIYWDFTNDPILDMIEFLIVFYRDMCPNQASLLRSQSQYETYFSETYGQVFSRICLGCGAGVFGMSFARLRLRHTLFLHLDEDRDELLFKQSKDFDQNFFESVKRIYGPRVRACADRASIRAQERDSCHALLAEFLQMFGGSPPLMIPFGNNEHSFNNKRSEDMEDDVLDQPFRPLAPNAGTRLPKGLEGRIMPDGRLYFVDHNTRTTSWNLPQHQVSECQRSTAEESENKTQVHSTSNTSSGNDTTTHNTPAQTIVSEVGDLETAPVVRAAKPPRQMTEGRLDRLVSRLSRLNPFSG